MDFIVLPDNRIVQVLDTKSAKELLRKGTSKYLLIPCPICTTKHWVQPSHIRISCFLGLCEHCAGIKAGQYSKDHHEQQMYWKGKHIPEETISKIKIANSYKHSEDHNNKIKISMLNKHITRNQLTKDKISKSTKAKWDNDNEYRTSHIEPNWGTPELKNEHISKMRRGMKCLPTKPELTVQNILDTLYPNQYKYVGNGHNVVIDGLIPDHININGQKKVILTHGTYWHRNDNTQDTIDRYAKYGFDCLIIWEHELKNIPYVENIIKEFHTKTTRVGF